MQTACLRYIYIYIYIYRERERERDVVYSHTNTSKNIIKHDLWTSMNEWTHFFIKVYLSHFILKRVDISVVCERWVERHTQREDFFFPYLLPGARGCQCLHPLASSSETIWSTACPLFDCNSCTLSKSDRMVLITWSLSGYTPVVPECPDCAALFTNHNMTACHSTRGH